jgi:hypothetical protein
MNTAREVVLHAVHDDAGMVHDDLTYLKPLATRLWNEARNEAFIQAQREKEREAVLQQLWAALTLPFDQALPTVKRFINADFKLLFDPRVAQWCADNAAAIQADHDANPRSKS